MPRSLVPFLVVGTAAVVAGGLAAAITGPTGWDDGSWVAAYLVLVVGVGQIGLGAGQSVLAADLTERRIVTEAGLLNGGSTLVIAGTLVDRPLVVTVGGLIVVGALGMFASAPGIRRAEGWTPRLYVGVLALLVVSTPIGLTLAWMRA